MQSNIEKFKDDLKVLIKRGNMLHQAIQHDCMPEEFVELYGEDAEKIVKGLPEFREEYQAWYSESLVVIKQILPDRVSDFTRHYEKPKPRKDISYENYRIEDYLQGISVTQNSGYGRETVVGPDAAIPHFRQQVAILNAVSSRFESSLYDIRQLVQADLFDSEIDTARELHKAGFLRASGAVAGVILEKHLKQVSENHNVSTRKRNPGINDFNELLKSNDVLDTPNWRQIQRLGDIRNLCDHNKEREPTKEEVEELISGVDKFLKTLY